MIHLINLDVFGHHNYDNNQIFPNRGRGQRGCWPVKEPKVWGNSEDTQRLGNWRVFRVLLFSVKSGRELGL